MARGDSPSKGSVRNRTLGAIHAGRRALRWDVETYRAFLQQLVNKESASTCTDQELYLILDEMRQRGFQRKEGSAPAVPRERATQLSKAQALWGSLAELGALTNPSESGFVRYVERMTGRSRPEWCTPAQLSKVIEGLKAWVQRQSTLPDVEESIAKGRCTDVVVEGIQQLAEMLDEPEAE